MFHTRHLKSLCGILIGLVASAAVTKAAPLLAVDFQDTTTSVTETGFSSFAVINSNLTANQTVVQAIGDYTVTVYGFASTSAVQGRDRGAITETGSFTYSDLLRDGVTNLLRSSSGAAAVQTTFSIGGLEANTSYIIQIWSLNKGFDNNVVNNWYDTTNGTGLSATFLGGITNASAPVPADNDSFSISSTVTSNSSGVISFGLHSTGGSGFLNGIVLTAIPEPSSFGLITGLVTLGWVAVGRRR